MPRGSYTQTRTFNYTNSNKAVLTTLLSATNPENGTVTYTYNSNMTLASKTDAKGQNFTYQYDTYNRLTSITWANASPSAQVLRTFMYDTNTITVNGVSYGSFSTYGAGRLVAVQNQQFSTMNGSTEGTAQFIEMYGYTQAGQPNAKMLMVNESFSNPLALTASYTYDNEGKMASVTYPNSGGTYTYSFDSMYRPVGLTGPSNSTLVSSVTYNAENQILGITSSNFGLFHTFQAARFSITRMVAKSNDSCAASNPPLGPTRQWAPSFCARSVRRRELLLLQRWVRSGCQTRGSRGNGRKVIIEKEMTSREELHRIIDSLADDQIAEVRRYVEELRGEEPLSEETLAAIREGLDDIEHGRVMDVQEYRRTRGV